MSKRRNNAGIPEIGQGVYTLAEVARYTELHPNTVRYWFKGRGPNSSLRPVLTSDYKPIRGAFAVSFLDLIDTITVGYLRKRKLKMSYIRLAFQQLQQDLGVEHPFCHRNLYTNGRQVFLDAANRLEKPKIIEVVSKQQFFSNIKRHLDSIEYSRSTNLASRWHICEGVVIDPLIGMGNPVVEPTGTATHILANHYHANGNDADLVADLFGLTAKQVINAVKFEDVHGRTRRAA